MINTRCNGWSVCKEESGQTVGLPIVSLVREAFNTPSSLRPDPRVCVGVFSVIVSARARVLRLYV